MKRKEAQPELDLFELGAPAPAKSVATSAALSPDPARSEPPRGLTVHEMRQAALGFLAAQRPVGVAGVVPARFRKYQVAAAAFWTRDRGKVKEVVRTAIVEIYDHRDRSFADCADRRSLLEAIRALREKREALEAKIRETEPELADRDDLFSEFRTWHYERSANPEYRKLRRKLEKLQHTLYQGSRLERIRRAAVADVLYLAVPAGLLESDEIALGWGLLYVHRDGRIEVRREPDPQLCDSASRNHLALNIASAAAASVLFSNGVQVDAAGKPRFYRPPRRRLKRVLTETP